MNTLDQEMIDLLAAAVGGVLSLVFEFFPVIKDWFAGLDKFQKQLVFGAIALVIAAVAFGLNCANVWAMIFPTIVLFCSATGAFSLLQIVVAVVGGAQVTNITVTKLIKMMTSK